MLPHALQKPPELQEIRADFSKTQRQTQAWPILTQSTELLAALDS